MRALSPLAPAGLDALEKSYSLASVTTSLLGAKFSRRSVASTARTLLSRLAREEASRRLGGAVVVFIRVLSEAHRVGYLWDKASS
jgi:hypothetical protein